VRGAEHEDVAVGAAHEQPVLGGAAVREAEHAADGLLDRSEHGQRDEALEVVAEDVRAAVARGVLCVERVGVAARGEQ